MRKIIIEMNSCRQCHSHPPVTSWFILHVTAATSMSVFWNVLMISLPFCRTKVQMAGYCGADGAAHECLPRPHRFKADVMADVRNGWKEGCDRCSCMGQNPQQKPSRKLDRTLINQQDEIQEWPQKEGSGKTIEWNTGARLHSQGV